MGRQAFGEMPVDTKAKNIVRCTYWGSDFGPRRFDILVGGLFGLCILRAENTPADKAKQ